MNVIVSLWQKKLGLITNWDNFESFVHKASYEELRFPLDESLATFSYNTNAPLADRVKLTEMLFETFSVAGLVLCDSAEISIASYGHTSLVVECAGGSTRCVAVNKLKALPNTFCEMKHLSGNYVTQQIFKDIKALAPNVAAQAMKGLYYFTVDDLIKKQMKLANTHADYVAELAQQQQQQKTIKLGGDEDVTIDTGINIFKYGELYFDKAASGDSLTLPELIVKSIQAAPTNLQHDLYANIHITAAAVNYNNIEQRVEQEVKALVGNSVPKVKVVAPSERMYRTWLSSQVLNMSKRFDEIVMTMDEYQEKGAAALLQGAKHFSTVYM